MTNGPENEWHEYYQAFAYFEADNIRDGNQPSTLLHEGGSDKAVILVHGLTDSPHFVRAIGKHFHYQLGYDVYIPLLQGHGLKIPGKMEGVTLAEWKKNVAFAIAAAASKSSKVSAGGLSTGGALCYLFGLTDPRVTGPLYLFSAALGLFDLGATPLGRVQEWLLATPLARLLDPKRPLVGKNPYRYNYVPLTSATELVYLIREIRQLHKAGPVASKKKKVFSAWTRSDRVISWKVLKKHAETAPGCKVQSFAIPQRRRVAHASILLKDPIYPTGLTNIVRPLERANPLFGEMLQAVTDFENTS